MFLLRHVTPFVVIVAVVEEKILRRFVMLAHEAGMTNGDYIYLTVDMIPGVNRANSFSPGDATNKQSREAFKSVYRVRGSVFILWCWRREFVVVALQLSH